jgi:hypothetical protein
LLQSTLFSIPQPTSLAVNHPPCNDWLRIRRTPEWLVGFPMDHSRQYIRGTPGAFVDFIGWRYDGWKRKRGLLVLLPLSVEDSS